MSKFGIYAEGPKVPIETHTSKLDENMKNVFNEIRNFVLSLGPNVVEEVRPHRIVYAKSFALRTFLDIEPMNDKLIINVKMEKRAEPKSVTIDSMERMEELKSMIREAHMKV